MIRTLLVSTDGSDHAQAAVDLGAELADKFGARLVLLHVCFRGGDLPEELFHKASQGFDQAKSVGKWTSDHPEWSRHHQILEYMGRSILDAADSRARELGAGATTTILEYGAPAERILHHARHLPADMIVTGSRGFSQIEGLILGSVSHRVFHSAPCGCVTVHRGKRQGAEANIGTVLVATDGSGHAAKAVEVGSTLAARSEAKLTLFHVLLRGAPYDRLYHSIDLDKLSQDVREELDPKRHPVARTPLAGYLSPDLSEAALREIGDQILARARETAKANGVNEPRIVTVDGDPARSIVESARNEKPDLIAMGSRGLSEGESMIAGSVSTKVNHAAPCTVMVVR